MSENNTNQFFDLFDEHPELLQQLIEVADAPQDEAPTRGMSSSQVDGVNQFVRQIVGNQLSDAQVNALQQQLQDNKVVQLFEGADGALDAKELLEYVGGLTGTKSANSNQPAVRAFLDGRLDLKEILIIIMLLKLFKRKQQQQTSYYGNSGLFGSLFGNQQQSYSGGLFSNLFGGNTYTNSYNNPYGVFSNLFGGNTYSQPNSLFSSLLGNQQQSYGLGSLFGGNTNANNNNLINVLNGFVNGNYNNNQQAYSLYNLLNNASQSSFNPSGTLNVNSLFSLLGKMLG